MIIYQCLHNSVAVKSFPTEEEARKFYEETSWCWTWRRFHTADSLFDWIGRQVRVAAADNFEGIGEYGELKKDGQLHFVVNNTRFHLTDVLEILDFGENDETVRIQLFR
jgi:hypothetical protein